MCFRGCTKPIVWSLLRHMQRCVPWYHWSYREWANELCETCSIIDHWKHWLIRISSGWLGHSWNLAWWHSRCLPFFFNPWFHDAIWAYLCTQCFWGQSDDGLDQFGRGTRHDQAFTSRIVDHFQHGIDRANSFFRRPASRSAFLFYCKAAHGIPRSTSGGRLHASHAGRTENDSMALLYFI